MIKERYMSTDSFFCHCNLQKAPITIKDENIIILSNKTFEVLVFEKKYT